MRSAAQHESPPWRWPPGRRAGRLQRSVGRSGIDRLARSGGGHAPAGTARRPVLRGDPVGPSGPTVTTYVYNTLDYNNCPRAKWNALTEAEVNQEFGSQKAQLKVPGTS